MLAQTRYPGINIEGYRALMDHFARELTARIDPGDEPRQVLRAINDYLFKELGFQGNEENYYDPENSYLNRVIDRRKGDPINLCLLYVLLARRLRLPLTGIGLPGHFICRYQSTGAEIYIDPFHAGKLLTKGDCVQYLVHGSFSLKEDYLTPVSPRRMFCGSVAICIKFTCSLKRLTNHPVAAISRRARSLKRRNQSGRLRHWRLAMYGSIRTSKK